MFIKVKTNYLYGHKEKIDLSALIIDHLGMTNKDVELVEKLKAITRDLGRKPTRNEFCELAGVTQTSFRHLTYNGLLTLAGIPLHPNQQKIKIDPSPPKILIIDIEVNPLKVHSYGIRDQYHGTDAIDEDWTILSFAAKFLDSEEIIYHAVDPMSPRDDREVVAKAFELLNAIDCAVGHNLNFDIKMLAARFLYYDLGQTRSFRSICTYKIARRHFRLSSNKLGYLASYLGVIEKLEHEKYAGMKLFIECGKGNPDAFNCLEDYNVRDVVTTEAVYLRLRKYDNSIRFNLFYQDNQCDCGSKEMRKLEPIITNAGAFNVFQCVDCNKVYRDNTNLIPSRFRSGLLR